MSSQNNQLFGLNPTAGLTIQTEITPNLELSGQPQAVQYNPSPWLEMTLVGGAEKVLLGWQWHPQTLRGRSGRLCEGKESERM
jgi:hypothetical protein